MINLLPDETKRTIRAARTNVLLLRYIFLTLGSVGLLFAVSAIFYAVLYSSQNAAVSKSTDNSAKVASYSETRKQADEYRNNLAIAHQILSNGVSYTNVMFQLAKLLPSGVVMDGLTLATTDFGQQTTLNAHAKTYAQATQMKENFQNSTLFTNVYLQNLTDEGSGADYPIAVTISAKLENGATQ